MSNEETVIKERVQNGEERKNDPVTDEGNEALLMDMGDDNMLEMTSELERILDLQNPLSTPPPLVPIDPLECRLLQQEEAESLRAIFDTDLTPLDERFTCFSVDIKYLCDDIQQDDVIKIWFSLPPNYPGVPPVFEIEANRSGTFTFADSDELFDTLTKEAINRVGGMMLYDLITIAQEQLVLVLDKRGRERETRLASDEERRQQIELEDALKSKKGSILGPLWGDVGVVEEAESTEEGVESTEEGVGSTKKQLSYRNIDRTYHPREFIGSISNIIKKLPSHLQITRVENVLRQDLAQRFERTRQSLGGLWREERANPLKYSLAPEIAFHGTLVKSLPSIVQHGLVIPGASNPVGVRCGSSLGKGIYLSPHADYSLGYAEQHRLIVCAVLRGLLVHDGVRLQFASGKKYFTIMSQCGSEWVFFNAAQVLPCYVIQVTQTNRKTKEYVPPPLVGVVKEEVEEDSKEKDKLQARARKYLPFGFGPGSKTVILEAGQIDDDEEDYGDYQLLRHVNSHDDERVDLEMETGLQRYREMENNSF